MNITTWQERSREISRQSVREFYDGALSETHAFLFETARLELPPHGGGFSLKLALSGAEEYFIGRRTVRVEPGTMLMINAGETYGSRIRQLSRSLSLFFTAKDVAAAGAALQSAGERRVDLRRDDGPAVEVPQIRFRASRECWRRVAELVHCLDVGRHDVADEAATLLLLNALSQLRRAVPRTALAGVRKRTTRDELMGRLVRATEYIEDMHGERCSLERLAAIACLSKFHFLRLFKEVFGQGPAAHARIRRLRRIAAVIARGESEDAAALQAGYANRYALRRALYSAGLAKK